MREIAGMSEQAAFMRASVSLKLKGEADSWKAREIVRRRA